MGAKGLTACVLLLLECWIFLAVPQVNGIKIAAYNVRIFGQSKLKNNVAMNMISRVGWLVDFARRGLNLALKKIELRLNNLSTAWAKNMRADYRGVLRKIIDTSISMERFPYLLGPQKQRGALTSEGSFMINTGSTVSGFSTCIPNWCVGVICM